MVLFVVYADESLEPRVQGLLGIVCLVGRFAGKKVHRTFFLFRLTPSSANADSSIGSQHEVHRTPARPIFRK